MKVIATTKANLPLIAHCHRVAFPASLTKALGQHYTEHMLSWYLTSEKTFLIHLEDELGQVLGYCGGMVVDGYLPTGSASGMAQHSFMKAICAFLLRPWVLWHPEFKSKWPLLQKNILMRMGLSPRVHELKQKRLKKDDPHVGLVVIGVDPQYHGMGYGSILLREFELRAVQKYTIYKLQLSVLEDNKKAIRAYERNGWRRGIRSGNSLIMVKVIPINQTK